MWKKVVLSILLVISVATGFFAAKAQVTIEGRLNKVNRDYDTDLSSVDLSNIHVETDSKVINILLLGDDYRTYDGSTSPGLNDVIMIGTLDMKHNTLKLRITVSSHAHDRGSTQISLFDACVWI